MPSYIAYDSNEAKLAATLVKYIEIAREQYGREWLPQQVDICKSALFNRMLSGKEPLPFAPPRAFSYPRYDIFDEPNKIHEAFEVVQDGDTLIINQCPWCIIQKVSDDEYLVKYKSAPVCRVWKNLDAPVSRVVDINPHNYFWFIQQNRSLS